MVNFKKLQDLKHFPESVKFRHTWFMHQALQLMKYWKANEQFIEGRLAQGRGGVVIFVKIG